MFVGHNSKTSGAGTSQRYMKTRAGTSRANKRRYCLGINKMMGSSNCGQKVNIRDRNLEERGGVRIEGLSNKMMSERGACRRASS